MKPLRMSSLAPECFSSKTTKTPNAAEPTAFTKIVPYGNWSPNQICNCRLIHHLLRLPRLPPSNNQSQGKFCNKVNDQPSVFNLCCKSNFLCWNDLKKPNFIFLFNTFNPAVAAKRHGFVLSLLGSYTSYCFCPVSESLRLFTSKRNLSNQDFWWIP